jgi:diamine N-acetyltransferase
VPKRLVGPLVGRRVRLRLLAAADLPQTLAWRNQEHIRRWFVHSDPLAWEQHQAWFQRYREREDDFLFVIEETDRLCRPVGQVGLYRIDWQARTAEYGRVLIGEPAAQGCGYAGEATALLLAFAFAEWDLTRVDLEVYAANERALHIYSRCGFESVALRDGLLQMQVTPERFAQSDSGRRTGLAA